ncbi:MAG: phage major capsid protein [Candidatus Thiodiazotropha sp. (ex Troendleina suluensis)]|nr:phage major capsid protein [Candidatus Thiodiazotropha sp. (ex Troendleina suluensis)]
MPIDETHGTATNASSIIVGDFTQLWIGIRQQLRIEILKEKYMDNLQMGFIAHLRADVALAHPQSFCRVEGVIPA